MGADDIGRFRFPTMSAAACLVAVLATAMTATASPGAVSADAPTWVRAWGAALMAPEEFDYYPGLGRSFEDATLRQIIVTTLAGRLLRVLISNAHGSEPLVVGAAHVARAAQAPRIDTGSDRALLFGGQQSVTIPPGAQVYSDPVDLATAAGTMLAVSLYLPRSTADSTSTVHEEGWRIGYLSTRGDFSAAERFPVSARLYSYFYLGAVDVLAARPASAVVTFGDSLTDGTGSTPYSGRTWPDDLARRLQAAHHGELAVVNMAIGGNRLLHDETGPSALSRADRDIFAIPGARFVIIFEGINDLWDWTEHPEQNVTAGQVIDALRELIVRAHAHGVRAIGATVTPSLGCPDCTAQDEAKRQSVNAWIRNSRKFDAVVDFDRVVRDPSIPARIASRFDCGDHVHLSDAGYAALARAVDLALFTAPHGTRAAAAHLPGRSRTYGANAVKASSMAEPR